MPKYDVHIYAIARLKVDDIDADSLQEAARKAEQRVDLHHAIARGEAEYADDIVGFLVDVLDEAGQRIQGQSLFFNPKEEVT
jgi:hypothetical protein